MAIFQQPARIPSERSARVEKAGSVKAPNLIYPERNFGRVKGKDKRLWG